MLNFVKTKNKEKLKTELFLLCPCQKQVCPFGHKYSIKFIMNFLFGDCSLKQKQGSCKFSKKYKFLRLPRFIEN